MKWYSLTLYLSIDVILQDFCSIVGNENLASPIPHELTFLRHVDDAIPSAPLCSDQSAPLDTMGSECAVIPSETVTDPPTDPADDATEAPSNAASGPQVVLALMVSAAVALL
jgi:hypothetical protein